MVALDSEVALAVECKSVSKPRKEARFQEILAKHAAIRERFVNAVNSQFPAEHKRTCALTVVTSDIILSSNDIERADEQKISLINESDLSYYENSLTNSDQQLNISCLRTFCPAVRFAGCP